MESGSWAGAVVDTKDTLFPVSPLGDGDQLGHAQQLGSIVGTQLGRAVS